jgi:hypothetical protein
MDSPVNRDKRRPRAGCPWFKEGAAGAAAAKQDQLRIKE